MIHHFLPAPDLLPLAEHIEPGAPDFGFEPVTFTLVLAVYAAFELDSTAGDRYLYFAADNGIETAENPHAVRWAAQTPEPLGAGATGAVMLTTAANAVQPATLAPGPLGTIPIPLPVEGLVVGATAGSTQSGVVSETGFFNAVNNFNGTIIGASSGDLFTEVAIWSTPFIALS
ncbi:MAG: hypothetical protein FWC87_01065 [Acidimicrobiaceae bacterium]|nr:hypothetical protein [Acidimicrobiaceae bacterium]